MSEKYCYNLRHGISFHQKNIRFCTTLQLGEIISIYEEKPKELALKIQETRRIIKKNLDNKIIPNGCENCRYRIQECYETEKIKRIDLYYWYHCNCGCFYCSYRDETKGEFSDKIKEGNPVIYKTIEELYRLDEIDKNNLFVNFGGGELGVLKEFPKLINLFLKNNVESIWCETSGIRYSKELAKALEKGKAGLSIAICSGSPETYKKIKKRDKYTQVLNNLKKYINAASKCKTNPNNASRVISKYIILQGFNNNINEIDKWLIDSLNIGIKQVEISMEFCWGIHTKKGEKVEDYNYELFEYTEKRCKQLGLALKKNETSLAIMKEGIY